MTEISVGGLANADMPGLFRAADRAALQGRQAHLRVILIQLVLLFVAVLSGVGASVTGMSWLGFVAVGAYTTIVTLRVYRRISQREKSWYENRQLAESMRSLAWRYSVGGDPFPVKGTGDADRDYLARVAAVLGDMKHAPVPDASDDVSLITETMKRLRALSLDERRGIYSTHRVMDQLRWYATRSKRGAIRHARLDAWFLVASAAAVFVGLMQAFDVISINLQGLCAISAAAVYSWQSQMRYGKQSTSYASAANHLTLVHTRMAVPRDEAEWSEFVDESEDGIGREHTSWRVSRSLH